MDKDKQQLHVTPQEKVSELEHASSANENLSQILKRIDNVLEWRFIDPQGETQLDADFLVESIDYPTLCAIRQCLIETISNS